MPRFLVPSEDVNKFLFRMNPLDVVDRNLIAPRVSARLPQLKSQPLFAVRACPDLQPSPSKLGLAQPQPSERLAQQPSSRCIHPRFHYLGKGNRHPNESSIRIGLYFKASAKFAYPLAHAV